MKARWVRDPTTRHDLRYHDGKVLTEHVSDAGVVATDPYDSANLPPAVLAADEPLRLPFTAKGVSGQVIVDEHFVTITRKGGLAKLGAGGWTKGEKRFPIGAVTAVQFKRPGGRNGFIQFTIPGGNESKQGVRAAVVDENSVVFTSGHTKEFERVREHVESAIAVRHSVPTLVAPDTPIDVADQLRKFAALRDDGILTEDEFNVHKAKLLE